MFLFPDQDLDCPAPQDMVAPRLRPVRAPPWRRVFGERSLQLTPLDLQGAGMERGEGGPGALTVWFPTDASTASPTS